MWLHFDIDTFSDQLRVRNDFIGKDDNLADTIPYQCYWFSMVDHNVSELDKMSRTSKYYSC